MRKHLTIIIGLLVAGTLSAQGWGPDIRLTNDPAESYTGYNNQWCVAVSGSYVHVVWFDNRDGNFEIYYKRSTDGGITWGSDTRLTNAPGDSKNPSIAVSGTYVYVVWSDGRPANPGIYYKRSADSGSTWGSDTKLTLSGGPYPCIAASGSNVHVVSDGINYINSTDNGLTWNIEIPLASGGNNPVVACVGNNVHVAWHTPPSSIVIQYKRSIDNGATWSSATTISTPGGGYSPSIAVSGNFVNVVFHDARDGNYELYQNRSTDNGVTWEETPTRITNSDGVSAHCSLAESGNNVALVWFDRRDGNAETYYKNSIDNGRTWGLDTRLTNALGESVGASIAAANSSVYVAWYDDRDGNREVYYKRYVEQGSPGTLAWRYQAGGAINSSPALALDGTVYFTSRDGYLYALNPDSSLKWRYNTGGTTDNSPAIGPDGTIYLGVSDGLCAITPEGDLKWKYTTGARVPTSPAIAPDGTIFFGGVDCYFYAINPSGTLKWRYLTGGSIYSSPSIDKGGAIYFASFDCYLYALTPSGTLKWKSRTSSGDEEYSSPAIADDSTIYFSSYDGWAVYAFNPDGSEKWKYPTGNRARSVVLGANGTIYAGSEDNYLYALTPEGNLKWKYNAGSLVCSNLSVGADEIVYFGSWNGYLYAVDTLGNLRWRYLTGALVNESSPAIDSNKILYVGSYDNYLYALNTSSPGLGASTWPKFKRDNQNTGNLLAADVGVVSIEAPRDTCWSEHSYTPRATFENFEAGTTSFNAVCEFDSAGVVIYSDTVAVADLAGGAAIEVSFDPWSAGEADDLSYTVKFKTLFEGDYDPKNDTLSKNVTALWPPRDVAPVAIITPPDFVWSGFAHIPRVVVKNLWEEAESFNVACMVDSLGVVVYSDTTLITNLSGSDSVLAEFGPWSAGASDTFTYNVTFVTHLAKDLNPSNDTITKEIHAVKEVADLDIQDYAGNLSANTMFLTGARNAILVGSYVMVNPDNWQKNVDLYDGPANTNLALSYECSDLVLYNGSKTIPRDSVNVNTNEIYTLGLGEARLNIVQVRLFHSSAPADAQHFVGKVIVKARGEGMNVSDEFNLEVKQVSGSSPLASSLCFGCEPLPEGNRLYWSRFGFGEQNYTLYRAELDSDEFTKISQNTLAVTEFTDYDVEPVIDYKYKLGLEMPNGKEITIGPLSLTSSSEVGNIVLYETSPNPWVDVTEISYFIPRDITSAQLKVYDITGKLVKTLVDGPQDSGNHSVTWDGTDERGRTISSGVYFYILNARDQKQTKKTILVR